MARPQVTNPPSRGQVVFKKHLFTFRAAEKKKSIKKPPFIPGKTLSKLNTEGRFCPIVTGMYLKLTSLEFHAQDFFLS